MAHTLARAALGLTQPANLEVSKVSFSLSYCLSHTLVHALKTRNKFFFWVIFTDNFALTDHSWLKLWVVELLLTGFCVLIQLNFHLLLSRNFTSVYGIYAICSAKV